ncbi:hypothetical protein BH23PSE2_BH23PSE2_01270 [soil metagenome]
MILSSALRPWALLAATLAWLWATSIFTPWAADRLPRLWLYDLLYYLRYVLIFWALAEAIHLGFHWRQPDKRRALLPLTGTVLVAIVAWAYQSSEAGLRWRVDASSEPASAMAMAGFSDERRRAGHFLVDTVREPCPGQPWLWLGRPHGGGSGTNVALVHTGPQPPHSPSPEAYAFWPAAPGWWIAYQHAAHDHRNAVHPSVPAACVPGRVLQRQREGQAWVEAGRRALDASRR